MLKTIGPEHALFWTAHRFEILFQLTFSSSLKQFALGGSGSFKETMKDPLLCAMVAEQNQRWIEKWLEQSSSCSCSCSTSGCNVVVMVLIAVVVVVLAS